MEMLVGRQCHVVAHQNKLASVGRGRDERSRSYFKGARELAAEWTERSKPTIFVDHRLVTQDISHGGSFKGTQAKAGKLKLAKLHDSNSQLMSESQLERAANSSPSNPALEVHFLQELQDAKFPEVD